MKHRPVVVVVLVLGLAAPAPAWSQGTPTVFKKVDFYVQAGDEMDGKDAQLLLDPSRRILVFAEEDDASRIFATVEWERITSVTYENSKHARITAGLLVAWPLFFLSGKKHWLTVTYGPGAAGEAPGYVFARMDKDNFQAILAAINGFTGQEIRRIEEDGQVSVLYPGRPSTLAADVPAGAESGGAPSGAAAASMGPPIASRTPEAGSSATIPAAPLPPAGVPSSGATVAMAPLPPLALETPIILNKGVQWTERAAGMIGYVWAAELSNPNAAEVSLVVVLELRNQAGAVLHENRHALVISANESGSFTAEGEVAVESASQGAEWSFRVEQVRVSDESTTSARETSQPGRPTTGVGTEPPPARRSMVTPTAASSSAPAIGEEPVPLTDDVTPPELIPETVTIVVEDPRLQALNLQGKLITLRCLVRSDGSVADAVVHRIAPAITLETADKQLKEAVRESAIRSWRFRPASRMGQAVSVWLTLTIRYEPGNR